LQAVMFQGQWSKVVNETEGTELTERQGYWLEQIERRVGADLWCRFSSRTNSRGKCQ